MGKTKTSVKKGLGGMSCNAAMTQENVDQAVRMKAQELYEKSGRKPGRDQENWLEAERFVKKQMCDDAKYAVC